MPDREKYIDIFKQIVKAKKKYYRNEEIPIRISYQCIVDILFLLKEHETVVRCKDCKHFDGLNCKVNDIVNIMDTNWFCADGERQEGR